MAALTATRISDFQMSNPVPLGGGHLEFWRIPAGSSADTSTITATGRQIISANVSGHVSSAITTNVVVVTYSANQANPVDVWLLVGD